MHTSTTITVVLVGLLFLVGFIWWYISHCSICSRFHFRRSSFLKCGYCGKKLCKDKINYQETILEMVNGVLGEREHILATGEKELVEDPCGYTYIITLRDSSYVYFHCCPMHLPRNLSASELKKIYDSAQQS